jgi:hypothetical protein
MSKRATTHPFLILFAQAEQNLLFGGPDYVSTSTTVRAGLRVSFKPLIGR